MKVKICVDCGIDFKTVRSERCKPCAIARKTAQKKKWNEENKDMINKKSIDNYNKKRDEIRKYQNEYKKKNNETIKKKYYEKNKDKYIDKLNDYRTEMKIYAIHLKNMKKEAEIYREQKNRHSELITDDNIKSYNFACKNIIYYDNQIEKLQKQYNKSAERYNKYKAMKDL